MGLRNVWAYAKLYYLILEVTAVSKNYAFVWAAVIFNYTYCACDTGLMTVLESINFLFIRTTVSFTSCFGYNQMMKVPVTKSLRV